MYPLDFLPIEGTEKLLVSIRGIARVGRPASVSLRVVEELCNSVSLGTVNVGANNAERMQVHGDNARMGLPTLDVCDAIQL